MFRFRNLSSLMIIPSLLMITSCSQPSQTTDNDLSQESSKTTEVAENDENSDVEYMTSLALMKGHLIVAEELLEAGDPKAAEPHIGHPVEEIYGDIEGELSARNVPEFKSTLNQFNDLVKTAPKSDQIKTQYQDSMEAIDQAIAAIPETKRQSPEFVLPVINRLLETANAEYKAAVANGKIVELLEYQDSRGFVMYSDQLYQSISETMGQKYPVKHQQITMSLEKLKTAWPTVTEPETLVMTPEQVSQLVTKIKENS